MLSALMRIAWSAGPLRVLICAALAVVGGAASAGVEEPILWNSAHTVVTFISGSVIDTVAAASAPGDGIPLPCDATQGIPLPCGFAQAAKLGLEARFRERREQLAKHPEGGVTCIPYNPGVLFFDKAPHSLSFADLIRRGGVAVVGTVERTVAGLLLDDSAVATHTFLRVTDVLRDTTQAVHRGQVVSFLVRGGTLTYKGARFCTYPMDNDEHAERGHVPAAGESLLLIAWPDGGAPPRELWASQLFVIEKGDIVPDAKAYPYLKDTTAKSISALRAELAANVEDHKQQP
jgi:hypothetical protein